MRTCLIFNEVAGRRRAARRLRGFLARHGQELELWPTQYAGHADGEVLFRPEQNVRRVQFEIFSRRLRVMVCEV